MAHINCLESVLQNPMTVKMHALKVGPEGGAFLIFEYWKNKDPVSVTVHWEGELVGEQHAQTKGDYVVNS